MQADNARLKLGFRVFFFFVAKRMKLSSSICLNVSYLGNNIQNIKKLNTLFGTKNIACQF